MPIQLLPIGPTITMLANVIYALPVTAVWLYTDAVSTLSMSNSPTFTTSVPVLFFDGGPSGTYSQYKLKSAFLRSSADIIVTLKRD